MLNRLPLLLILIVLTTIVYGQTVPVSSCGQPAVMQQLYAIHPELKIINDQAELSLAAHSHAIQSGSLKLQRTAGIVTLPVVVHIIHNNRVNIRLIFRPVTT